MTDSLSIVVPVHNAQASLTHQVQALLELLPDLTARFQVVIVDDGSTDHTPEVAAELARQYPQVRAVSRREQQGIAAAAEAGVAEASGDVVIVQQAAGPVVGCELLRLWRTRDEAPAAPKSRRTRVARPDRTARTGASGRHDSLHGKRHANQELRGDPPHAGPVTRFRLIRKGKTTGKTTATQTSSERVARRPHTSATASIPAPLLVDAGPLLDQSIRTLYS